MTPCDHCQNSNKIIIPGRGPHNALVMFVGERPGKDEAKSNPPTCWIGKAGKELENYIIKVSNISLERCYFNNLVKCHAPGDKNPTVEEIACCSVMLEKEIAEINPRYIMSLGAFSTKYFLGDDVTLERIHGIPIEKGGRVILPAYHPAAGLHNSTMMIPIVNDFEVLGKLIRGGVKVGSVEDEYPNPVYKLVDDPVELNMYLAGAGTVAIDTESVKDKNKMWTGGTIPWCVSVSCVPGTGMMAVARDEEVLDVIRNKLANPSTGTLIHNSMYDLPILKDMNIVPARFQDTMVMAYLTQSLPQGLKDLAYRLRGMVMSSYEEMVSIPSKQHAVWYLDNVEKEVWPDPEPELVWSRGEPSVKKGWPLHKRVARILKDYGRDDKVDIVDRWYKIEDKLRNVAEAKYGLLPIGDLSEIDIDTAVNYACRDADATLRVWPDLKGMLEGMNIERR